MSAVYIARNGVGSVVYVGRTGNLTKRLQQHHSSPWWDESVTFEVRMCRCAADAVLLEADLIAEHDPPNNVDGAPSASRAMPSERCAQVLQSLHDAGRPLTTAEIRQRTGYRNASRTAWHLRNAGRLKVVALTPGPGRTGLVATWALPNWPGQEVA